MTDDFKLAYEELIERRIETVYKSQKNIEAARDLENELLVILKKAENNIKQNDVEHILEQVVTIVGQHIYELNKATYRLALSDGFTLCNDLSKKEQGRF
ncbi:hypothetical protein [Lysinibacillus sp. 3P01SB]|uniref:hypothetical protein n=1 Tax=Lysinibacillus sp. 3P01SB TaxID=3132284 RepID=UPI0039A46E79